MPLSKGAKIGIIGGSLAVVIALVLIIAKKSTPKTKGAGSGSGGAKTGSGGQQSGGGSNSAISNAAKTANTLATSPALASLNNNSQVQAPTAATDINTMSNWILNNYGDPDTVPQNEQAGATAMGQQIGNMSNDEISAYYQYLTYKKDQDTNGQNATNITPSNVLSQITSLNQKYGIAL